jgi:hypothetical protein
VELRLEGGRHTQRVERLILHNPTPRVPPLQPSQFGRERVEVKVDRE